MKNDLKNIILTLGLIGITFTGGFLAYHNNLLENFNSENNEDTEYGLENSISEISDISTTDQTNSLIVSGSSSVKNTVTETQAVPKQNTYRSRRSQAS